MKQNNGMQERLDKIAADARADNPMADAVKHGEAMRRDFDEMAGDEYTPHPVIAFIERHPALVCLIITVAFFTILALLGVDGGHPMGGM